MSASSSGARRNPRPSPRPAQRATSRVGGRASGSSTVGRSSSHAATAAAVAEPRRERGDAARRRPELRVVDAPVPRHRLMVFGASLVGVVLFGSLFALAAFHTVIVQGQLQMDRLDRSIDKAQSDRTELRYVVADLSSPQRILDEAARLQMVQPQDPVYLQPVTPGGAVTVPPYSATLTAKRLLNRPVVAPTTLPTTTVPTAPTTTVASAAKTAPATKATR